MTTDIADLVSRLRETWPIDPGFGPITTAHRNMIHEAATALETAHRRIEELEGALSKIAVDASFAHMTKRGSDDALDAIAYEARAFLQPKEQQP